MKKVLLCVNCLKDIGGISTAASNLINEIHNKYNVTLCLTSNYISPNYQLPSNVRIVSGSNYLRDVIMDRAVLAGQSWGQKVIRNVRRLLNHYILKTKGIEWALSRIKIEEQFDVAIAFSDYRYSRTLCKCYEYDVVLNNVSARKKIAWIHNDPTKLGWTRSTALARLSDFDAIVNVSESCKEIFDRIIPDFKYKSHVVYNTYNIEKILTQSIVNVKLYTDNGNIHFVTVARIQTEQKRIDRVVKVCQRLKDEGLINFDWTLVGNGPELGDFVNKVKVFGLSNLIRFVGLQPNPYPYMKQADAFILTSSYEGFGMTIRESLILGTPTFVTNFGPANETVENERQGEICENSTDGVYKMIKSILQSPDKINKYREYISQNPIDNSKALEQFDNICITD